MLYPSFAQNDSLIQANQDINPTKIKVGIENYKKALESDNLGMIESAILNVMKLKFNYPDYDYSSLIEPLESLENNDRSKSIKFMSYIVKNYLEYPDRYTWINKATFEVNKDFYTVIAEKISAQVDE
jgi:hypothetical protein